MGYFELYNIDHSAILDDFENEGEAFDQLREILEHDGPLAFASLALVSVGDDERRTVVARQQGLLELVRPSTVVP
jgi:hypothetical protein